MNERHLQRRFRSSVITTSLPLVACGGTTGGSEFEGGGATSSGGNTGKGGETSGGTTSGGSGGVETGGTSAGGASGGSAGDGNGGSGGLSCSGWVAATCFQSRTVTIGPDCMDPTQPPTTEQCRMFCPTMDDSGPLAGFCNVLSYDEESISISCQPCGAIGRRPAGFVGEGCREQSLGAELANMALLEAVSVHAFRDLRRELAGHGAPRSLLRRLSRAGRDEIRHARRMRALARRFGGQIARVPRPEAPARSLEAIALENMVEGCVRETFGALVAHYQSENASDPELRGALARIARDETQHAALSFALHAWLERRLDRSARERVKAAQKAAAERLYAELAVPTANDERGSAGFPSPEAARALFRSALPALWS